MKRFGAPFASLLFFSNLVRISVSQGVIGPGLVIRDGQTLASAGGIFELGFFSPVMGSSFQYLGIWYKNITPRVVVWVANREIPLLDTFGAVHLTSQGGLVLVNSSNGIHWSSNISRIAQDPVVQLLDSGNLIVREKNDEDQANYLWQGFDYPGDTLLPGMKLRKDLQTGFESYLSIWKSTENPAPGQLSILFDARGYPQVMIKEGSQVKSRVGSWNGITWAGTPFMLPSPSYRMEFELNEKEVYFKYEVPDGSALVRERSVPGVMLRSSWDDQTHNWQVIYSTATDACHNYALCGAYSSCTYPGFRLCSCLYGFVPKSPSEWNSGNWSGGCVRRTPLNFDPRNRFLNQSGIRLPDTSSSTWNNSSRTLKECERLCLSNCNCTAYAYLDIRGTGCLFWHGELIDIRTLSEGGQDLFVRLAASELDELDRKRASDKQKQAAIIAGCVLSAIVFLTLVVRIILFLSRKRIGKVAFEQIIEDVKDETEFPIFDLTTVAGAINNFSSGSKVGEGGFGPVYKGTLADGQEIAVKRLSKSSGQGLKEFKTEVMLIAKLQHRNLVRLLGCCIDEDEKMLIYEYMANKSLDFYIFDKTRSKMLDWAQRKNVIGGIARGLLYLHQDSNLKIIHRDLKASNILLDRNMNPKISDFGLARACRADQSQAKTKKVVGTYGYMAPEYMIDGLFSTKSDVFSFGVLILEIVSGQKNHGFYHPNHDLNLVGHAWMLWIKGTPLELIDECVAGSWEPCEVTRCIHVALLCVQQQPENRPTMATVVMMLSGENLLPEPNRPGYFMARNPPQPDARESYTGNGATITVLGAR